MTTRFPPNTAFSAGTKYQLLQGVGGSLQRYASPRTLWIGVCAVLLLSALVVVAPYVLQGGAVAGLASIYKSDTMRTTFVNDPENLLDYRNHLERATSPQTFIRHSDTLTFDHIYVLSLPARTDRREQMLKISRALGLRITFVDASLKEEPFIKWIAERVAEVRTRKVPLLAETRRIPPETVGGLAIGSIWWSPTLDEAKTVPYPPYPADPRWAPHPNWVEYLEAHYDAGTLDELVPSKPNLNVTRLLWDPVERLRVRQVSEGVISTYWGHTRAMRAALSNGDRSALILEDDVDIEWDVERLWAQIHRRLPEDTDMTFLGHCWGHEIRKPQFLHPWLHRSTSPMCLHAYALTAQGMSKMLGLLLDPWMAYGTAVDLAPPSMLYYDELTAFSIKPPLIIQRKDGPSDIQKGNGSRWHGILMDSTWRRILKDEGVKFGDENVLDQDFSDPARAFREEKCEDM